MSIDFGGDSWQVRALEAAGLGTWAWEPERALRWSDGTYRIFGVDPRDFRPSFETYCAKVHPDDRDEVAHRIQRALELAETGWVLVHRLVRPDGEVRWVECRGEVLQRGGAIRMLGTIQDITDRKQAEAEAEASEARLAAILRNTPNVALQLYDLEGRVLSWNPASERMFGFSEVEAVGRTLEELIHTPEEFQHFLQTLEQVRSSGRATTPTEYAFHRGDGSEGWCLSTIFPVSQPGEEPVFACMDIDQTERHRLEVRMARAERLESLGRLAGGVAHDFNNLLTSILGFTDLAWHDAGADGSLRLNLTRVREAAERGAALTQQLLAYARRQIVNPRRVDPPQLLRQVWELLPRMVGGGVELELCCSEPLPPVLIDPVQFDQIVLNLVINASDAMPDGGTVTVSAERLRIPEGESDPGAEVPPGDWVVISVADTGPGVPSDVLPHVFEPFYTTKPIGRGTGLGLATCYGIVRQNGGHITVGDEGGAVFRVHLPVCEGPIDARSATPPLGGEGRETILVVEDDRTVRALACAVLRQRGYRVLDASDGQEAWEVVRLHPQPIHLLFTDLVMPRMNGLDLARRLAQARPELRILITSGYAGDAAHLEQELPPGAVFLQKPYTPALVTTRVRELLATRSTRGSTTGSARAEGAPGE